MDAVCNAQHDSAAATLQKAVDKYSQFKELFHGNGGVDLLKWNFEGVWERMREADQALNAWQNVPVRMPVPAGQASAAISERTEKRQWEDEGETRKEGKDKKRKEEEGGAQRQPPAPRHEFRLQSSIGRKNDSQVRLTQQSVCVHVIE